MTIHICVFRAFIIVYIVEIQQVYAHSVSKNAYQKCCISNVLLFNYCSQFMKFRRDVIIFLAKMMDTLFEQRDRFTI